MVIPLERFNAALLVFQCALLSLAINIVSVPYNAAIIAHEKMSAFAYISLLEAIFKLGILYLLFVSPFDRLCTYAILLLIVSLIRSSFIDRNLFYRSLGDVFLRNITQIESLNEIFFF